MPPWMMMSYRDLPVKHIILPAAADVRFRLSRLSALRTLVLMR